VSFENGQEVFALSSLLDRPENSSAQSGGPPPAPEADKVPDIAKFKALSGNDLLAALAADAVTLRNKFKEWQAAAQKISARLPNWHLAERLVRLGAGEQSSDLDSIETSRQLLAEPDPVPPLVSAAADALRTKLNEAHMAWETAWAKGEQRLVNDVTWGRLTPEQKHTIRQQCRLLPVTKPVVDTAHSIAEALGQRGLSEWENMIKALPTRIDDALAEAAALLEPKARTVNLPGVLLKTKPELDEWLDKVRDQIAKALASGPVIPRV
jgi:hypothetical protein